MVNRFDAAMAALREREQLDRFKALGKPPMEPVPMHQFEPFVGKRGVHNYCKKCFLHKDQGNHAPLDF